ncbi:MAG: hypothetical protein M3327_00110 [Actinomycetota bacterium]|nr:hypothetical protein [Actinomycetota bacterium]
MFFVKLIEGRGLIASTWGGDGERKPDGGAPGPLRHDQDGETPYRIRSYPQIRVGARTRCTGGALARDRVASAPPALRPGTGTAS